MREETVSDQVCHVVVCTRMISTYLQILLIHIKVYALRGYKRPLMIQFMTVGLESIYVLEQVTMIETMPYILDIGYWCHTARHRCHTNTKYGEVSWNEHSSGDAI